MATLNYKIIGQRIKDARTQANYTQAELGDSLRLSQPAIARIESGDSSLTLGNLVKLSQVLHRPVTYFLGLDSKLAKDEDELVELFRALPEGLPKELVLDLLRTLVQRVKEETGN